MDRHHDDIPTCMLSGYIIDLYFGK